MKFHAYIMSGMPLLDVAPTEEKNVFDGALTTIR